MELAGLDGWAVRFRCRVCGSVAQRPALHLLGRYGARTLKEVERRARCLTYRDGLRCGGAAAVVLEKIPPPSPKHVSNWGTGSQVPWSEVETGPGLKRRRRW